MALKYLIIGSGIIGISIATEVISQYPNAKIIILEKEPDVAYHSSDRNSGILHDNAQLPDCHFPWPRLTLYDHPFSRFSQHQDNR